MQNYTSHNVLHGKSQVYTKYYEFLDWTVTVGRYSDKDAWHCIVCSRLGYPCVECGIPQLRRRPFPCSKGEYGQAYSVAQPPLGILAKKVVTTR